MVKNNFNYALIIGAGSVGKKHIKNLLKYNYKLIICDISNKSLDDAKKLANEAILIKNLKELDKEIINRIKIGVISSWGTDHHKSFKELSKLNIKKIILEKPLAASEKEVDDILKLAKKKKIKFILHHRRYFNGIERKINEILKINNSPPSSMIYHAGSTCLVTTGVHFLDLACNIYKESPIKVISDIHNDKINPRHTKLGYYSGFIKFVFPNNKTLNMITNNNSRVGNSFSIYSKKLRIDLEGDRIFYGLIPKEKNIRIKITNHKIVKRDKYFDIANKNYYSYMIKELMKNNSNSKLQKKYCLVMKGLLGALWSSHLDSRWISLKNTNSIRYNKKWPVS